MLQPIVALFAILTIATPVGAAEPQPYSLIAPSKADSLRSVPASPVRETVLSAATLALQRTPHAMPHIHLEGTLPHQGMYDASITALEDFPAARDLALAFRLTGEPRFAAAAVRLISAWLEIYQPNFNPIDETGFDALLIALDLLPEDQRSGLTANATRLLRSMCNGYLDQSGNSYRMTKVNNWQSHRVKLITLSAYAVGDAALVERARMAYLAQLAANIRPDGSTIDFAQRDAIHYVVYDLEPLTEAALAAQLHGETWFAQSAASGVTLGLALDWLVPYANGTRTHDEFVNTTVAFDRERRLAGVPGFVGLFVPTRAGTVFAYAARLDPRYVPLARSLHTKLPWLDLIQPLPD